MGEGVGTGVRRGVRGVRRCCEEAGMEEWRAFGGRRVRTGGQSSTLESVLHLGQDVHTACRHRALLHAQRCTALSSWVALPHAVPHVCGAAGLRLVGTLSVDSPGT